MLKIKKEVSISEKERGASLLSSVKIVINVLFALLIFQIFLILPRPDDPALTRSTLMEVFAQNGMTLLAILIGITFVIIYWIQFNRQIGNLTWSTPVHASLAVAQMFCLMIYMYFLRFDMEFDGMIMALVMESVFLALAGFIGAFNWRYARLKGLTSENIDDNEEARVFYELLPEPTTSLFTLPFAFYGPLIWTIAFLAIVPITMICNRLKKKYVVETTPSTND